MTTKNNKQNEAIRALSEWAEEDKENRSMIVITDDERSTHVCYNGIGNNLANAIANATLQDDKLCAVCNKAMLLYINNKANDDDNE